MLSAYTNYYIKKKNGVKYEPCTVRPLSQEPKCLHPRAPPVARPPPIH